MNRHLKIIGAAIITASIAIPLALLNQQLDPGTRYATAYLCEHAPCEAGSIVDLCELSADASVFTALGVGGGDAPDGLAELIEAATSTAALAEYITVRYCHQAPAPERLDSMLSLVSIAPDALFNRVILEQVEVREMGGEWRLAPGWNDLLTNESLTWRRTAQTVELAHIPVIVGAGEDPCLAAGLAPGCDK